MDLSTLGTSLQTTLGEQLPAIAAGLGILVLGWLVAVVVRAVVRRGLGLIKLNAHIAGSTEKAVNAESAIAAGAFWLIILITLIALFNTLNLPLVSEPFQLLVTQIVGYLPNLLAGTILVVVAWLIGTLLRALANKAMQASQVDEKLSEHAGMQPMSKSVGNVLFWLVILLFTPAFLAAYNLSGLLDPVGGMLDEMLAMVPNIFAALVIAFVGWLVGRILASLATNVLAATGVDGVGARAGLDERVKISRLIGTLVLIFVFVPALIAALEALQIQAISGPATQMLNKMMLAVPSIVAAALILIITYYVARFVARIVTRLAEGLGFDTLAEKMHVSHIFSGPMQPSRLAGSLVLFFAMLFATVEAASQLEFTQVRDIVSTLITFGGEVLLGAVIFVVGLWLADLAYGAVKRSRGEHSAFLANITRFAIMGLVIAMGLRAMGIADDIVNMAFAFTFGAIAVAAALSFGLGGREAAGKQMDRWLTKINRP